MTNICPKCNKEIDNLIFDAQVQTWGHLSVNEGELDWDKSEDGDWENIVICCPECDATLFKGEIGVVKARDFLMNKDKLQELLEKKVNERRKKRSN